MPPIKRRQSTLPEFGFPPSKVSKRAQPTLEDFGFGAPSSIGDKGNVKGKLMQLVLVPPKSIPYSHRPELARFVYDRRGWDEDVFGPDEYEQRTLEDRGPDNHFVDLRSQFIAYNDIQHIFHEYRVTLHALLALSLNDWLAANCKVGKLFHVPGKNPLFERVERDEVAPGYEDYKDYNDYASFVGYKIIGDQFPDPAVLGENCECDMGSEGDEGDEDYEGGEGYQGMLLFAAQAWSAEQVAFRAHQKPSMRCYSDGGGRGMPWKAPDTPVLPVVLLRSWKPDDPEQYFKAKLKLAPTTALDNSFAQGITLLERCGRIFAFPTAWLFSSDDSHGFFQISEFSDGIYDVVWRDEMLYVLRDCEIEGDGLEAGIERALVEAFNGGKGSVPWSEAHRSIKEASGVTQKRAL